MFNARNPTPIASLLVLSVSSMSWVYAEQLLCSRAYYFEATGYCQLFPECIERSCCDAGWVVFGAQPTVLV